MSRFLPTTPYRGTRDFLPEEMSVRQQVFNRLYEIIERYGFARYDGPVLEPVDIYEAKSGREIADLQLYSLEDRSGRRLALRPEMTPTAARMIAGNAGRLQFPVRWYSHPSCYRYERPQRGRVREHWQINVDIFGSESHRCEIEIFELIHDMMGSLGAKSGSWILRVNDRTLLTSFLVDVIGIPEDRVRDVSSIIDRWEKRTHDELAASAVEMGMTVAQFDRLSDGLRSGPALLDQIPAEIKKQSPVGRILESSAGDLITFDPIIVRAFEYYTSTVFEVFDRHPDNNRALFGGGRYSDLVGLFSNQKIPGIGFGFGDVTLFDFLETHDLAPAPRSRVDVVVMPLADELIEAADSLARLLRDQGLRTSVPLEQRKLGKELAAAAESGAKVAVIIGTDEWAAKSVIIRDLATRQQDVTAIGDVHDAVRRLVAPTQM